ncbi:hypothetical protein AAG570_000339 [Ranatra chinensis]|uniref:Thiamine transporter 2 n=1 Tax=Ranatra chinensis TaxID=642074 RepID=A0ABD0Z9G3_9HEMI
MDAWWKISLLLCCFGVLKEFRPSEPFVTKYFNNPPVNFSIEVINEQIYPVGTYANMVLLVIIFLVTDYLRYKPIIILQGVSGIIVYIMIIVCRDVWAVQLLEVFYGLFMACDVAYYTYTYAKVDKSHYQTVTGHTRAAYLIGRAISGIVSQVLISSDSISYYGLNFFTLGG